MSSGGLAGGIGRFVNGLFFVNSVTMGLAVLQDLDRGELRREGAMLAERDDVAQLRNDTLRRLGAREVFGAGRALLEGPDGRTHPRRIEVVVTETDLVLLDAEGRRLKEQIERLASEGEWVTKIPRGEVTGVRLLDQHGEPVSVPPTELEELEHPDRLHTVWVDRRMNGDTGSHVFVFHAWSTADEARRDFERAVASTP